LAALEGSAPNGRNVNSKARKENQEETSSTIQLNENHVRSVPAAATTLPDRSTTEEKWGDKRDFARPHLRNPYQLSSKQGKGIAFFQNWQRGQQLSTVCIAV
jgi:hypothetical protein